MKWLKKVFGPYTFVDYLFSELGVTVFFIAYWALFFRLITWAGVCVNGFTCR